MTNLEKAQKRFDKIKDSLGEFDMNHDNEHYWTTETNYAFPLSIESMIDDLKGIKDFLVCAYDNQDPIDQKIDKSNIAKIDRFITYFSKEENR